MPAFLVCNDRTAQATLSQSTAVIAVVTPEWEHVSKLYPHLWHQKHPDRYLQIRYTPFDWSFQTLRPDLKFFDCLQFIEHCLSRFGYDSSFALYSGSSPAVAYTFALLLYTYWFQNLEKAVELVEWQFQLPPWEEPDEFLLLYFCQHGSLKELYYSLFQYCQQCRKKRQAFLNKSYRERRIKTSREVPLSEFHWLES